MLGLLDNYHMPESTYDGLFEMLAMNGFDGDSLEEVIGLQLVEMDSGQAEIPDSGMYPEYEDVQWFELTEMGNEVMRAGTIAGPDGAPIQPQSTASG